MLRLTEEKLELVLDGARVETDCQQHARQHAHHQRHAHMVLEHGDADGDKVGEPHRVPQRRDQFHPNVPAINPAAITQIQRSREVVMFCMEVWTKLGGRSW